MQTRHETGRRDAVEAWTDEIRRNPRDAGARKARGAAFADQGDFDLAAADFAEALRLDPNPVLRYCRGVEYFRMGDLGMAIAELTNALTIAPDFLEALDRRAEAFRMLGDRPRAALDERSAERIRAQALIPFAVETAPEAPREMPLKTA